MSTPIVLWMHGLCICSTLGSIILIGTLIHMMYHFRWSDRNFPMSIEIPACGCIFLYLCACLGGLFTTNVWVPLKMNDIFCKLSYSWSWICYFLGKIVMLFLFVSKLREVFNGSSLAIKRTRLYCLYFCIATLCVCMLTIVIILAIFNVHVMKIAGFHQRAFCFFNSESSHFRMATLIAQIFDTLFQWIVLFVFVSKLLKLMTMGEEAQTDRARRRMTLLIRKMTVLIFCAILSTNISTSSLFWRPNDRSFGLIYLIPTIDSVLNGACVYLMFTFAQPAYSVLCGPCDKCAAKCKCISLFSSVRTSVISASSSVRQWTLTISSSASQQHTINQQNLGKRNEMASTNQLQKVPSVESQTELALSREKGIHTILGRGDSHESAATSSSHRTSGRSSSRRGSSPRQGFLEGRYSGSGGGGRHSDLMVDVLEIEVNNPQGNFVTESGPFGSIHRSNHESNDLDVVGIDDVVADVPPEPIIHIIGDDDDGTLRTETEEITINQSLDELGLYDQFFAKKLSVSGTAMTQSNDDMERNVTMSRTASSNSTTNTTANNSNRLLSGVQGIDRRNSSFSTLGSLTREQTQSTTQLTVQTHTGTMSTERNSLSIPRSDAG